MARHVLKERPFTSILRKPRLSTEEILKSLEEYKKVAPKNLAKIDQIAEWVKNIDKEAADESIKQKSIKPISIEVVKQAGGWGATIAGARIGVVAGAAVGIETGPGAIVSGAIGGIIFGTAGYLGASWLTEYLQD